jgi:hypothetical protein
VSGTLKWTLVATLAFCSSTLAVADGANKAFVPPKVKLLLSSSSASYPSSDDVRIQFEADNYGPAIVWAPHPPPVFFRLRVFDAEGNFIPQNGQNEVGHYVIASAHHPTLAAGAHFVFADFDDVTTLFELRRWGYKLATPGTYYIEGLYGGWNILTNRVKIVLTGAASPVP